MAERQQVDILVSGAGLAGKLAALALADAGFSVALAGRASANPDRRTTALSYASVRVLERLGIWEAVGAEAEPIRHILVTDGTPADRFRAGHTAGPSLHFPASLIPEGRQAGGTSALGFMVENAGLGTALDAALDQQKFVTRLVGAEVIGLAPGPAAITARLRAQDPVRAGLVVIADGRASPLARALGLYVHEWGYGQTALVCNVTHSGPHDGVAHERFLPGGPFAILPLRGNQSSIVLTERDDAAAALLALPPPAFRAALRARMGDGFGAVLDHTPPQPWPLRLAFAPNPIGKRCVLIGDAAHAIHPIAGQGFNLGVKDVAALHHVLAEARHAGLDPGYGTGLARYARWRRFDTASLALGTDALNRLFSNNWGPLRAARRLGLGAVDKIDPLRRLFVRQAGADLGDLPALMQP